MTETAKIVAAGVDPITRYVLEQSVGFTDTQLSKRSGFSANAISSWRRGRRSPTVASIAAVAEAAGFEIIVRPRALVGG